jgi:hypothetical protein
MELIDMNERYWTSLEAGAHSARTFFDELWKVWRWFGIGVLGFGAYDATGSTQALIFSICVTVIGVGTLVSWIFSNIIKGVTSKGRASGVIVSVGLGFLIFLISTYLAIQLWAIVTVLALPVFSAR